MGAGVHSVASRHEGCGFDSSMVAGTPASSKVQRHARVALSSKNLIRPKTVVRRSSTPHDPKCRVGGDRKWMDRWYRGTYVHIARAIYLREIQISHNKLFPLRQGHGWTVQLDWNFLQSQIRIAGPGSAWVWSNLRYRFHWWIQSYGLDPAGRLHSDSMFELNAMAEKLPSEVESGEPVPYLLV